YKQIDSNDHYQQIIATRRTAFIATATPSGNEIAKINRPEAELIAQFVKAYYKLQKANNLECNPSEEVGIIVPFRNQIAMVTHAIARLDIPNSNNIVIDTVERFQGSQREVILFGTTIWQPEQLEILSSPITDAEGNIIDRKLNVALTRARRRMYIFGNKDILSASPLYKALIEELN
ncbi:MAG: ATP-dependent helicase, partial [Bacteroidaceae bacterium]|nr:ATP-dependent helicase [Bacteroidaceae bacterium]